MIVDFVAGQKKKFVLIQGLDYLEERPESIPV